MAMDRRLTEEQGEGNSEVPDRCWYRIPCCAVPLGPSANRVLSLALGLVPNGA